MIRRLFGRTDGPQAAPTLAASQPSPHLDDARVQRRQPPERLDATKRDPQTALRFRDIFEADAAKACARATLGRQSELAREVLDAAWYHTIELPDEIVTPGMFDHRLVLDDYGLPNELNGMRCLDVACADGFWAFEFERRGGDVTAIDVDSPAEYDLPTGASVALGAGHRPLSDSFAIAHRALCSTVKCVHATVYDLDPRDLGTFDLVHSGDVLLHLERPLEALRRIRAMTKDNGSALIADSFDPELKGTVTRYHGGFEGLLWWFPSLDCLVQMVYDAGFGTAEVVSTYNLPAWDDAMGYWRAVIRARP